MTRWTNKEIEFFNHCFQDELKKIESEAEKHRFAIEFNLAIGELKSANSRFIKALVFASAATLFCLLWGFEYAFACAMMLFFAPHMLSSTLSQRSVIRRSPISLIEQKSEKRDVFASAVWSIAFSAIIACGIYYWGTLEPGEGDLLGTLELGGINWF